MKKELSAFLFWERVDKIRNQKEITLEQLAATIGIKHQSIRDQRSKDLIPKSETLYRISKALDTPMEYLLTGEVSKPESLGDKLYNALLEQAPAVLQGLIETYIEKRDTSSAPRMA